MAQPPYSALSHLECARCGASHDATPGAGPVLLRLAAARALRPWPGRRAGGPRGHRPAPGGPVALPRTAAGLRRRAGGQPGRGHDAAAGHAAPGPGAGRARAADEGRGAHPHRHLQGARRQRRACPAPPNSASPGWPWRPTGTREPPGRPTPRGPGCPASSSWPPTHRPSTGPNAGPPGPNCGCPAGASRRRAGSSPRRCRPAPVTRTYPRSRSPTGSRARKRWASRSPSSSAGGCPTSSSTPPAAASGSSASTRRSGNCASWAGSGSGCRAWWRSRPPAAPRS